MNAGQVASFLWTVVTWFFILSVFAVPLWLAVEHRRNQAEKKRTEAVLKATKHTPVQYWDAS